MAGLNGKGKRQVTVGHPRDLGTAPKKRKPQSVGREPPKTCAQPSGKIERWICSAVRPQPMGSVDRFPHWGGIWAVPECVVEASSWFQARALGEMQLGLQRGEVEARLERKEGGE